MTRVSPGGDLRKKKPARLFGNDFEKIMVGITRTARRLEHARQRRTRTTKRKS